MMNLKTIIILLLTGIVLAASIYLPAKLLEKQDHALLEKIHSEKMPSGEESELSSYSILDKLELIASAGQSGSGTYLIETSSHLRYDSDKLISMARTELSLLAEKGLIPETDLTGFSIQNITQETYSNPSTKLTLSCYSFSLWFPRYSLHVSMDAETGKIYSLNFSLASIFDDFQLPENTVDIWSGYLDIPLKLLETVEYELPDLYRIGDSPVNYLIYQNDQTMELYISPHSSTNAPYGDAVKVEKGEENDAADR